MDELHDFFDGKGPVPAHRHLRGYGWVSNDSEVDAATEVSADSCVTQASKVGGSRVLGGSRVDGWSLPYSPPQAQIGRWRAYQGGHDVLFFGCERLHRDRWTPEAITELAIKHKATDYEIQAACWFVAFVASLPRYVAPVKP
jgi:hypothetical protein